MNLARLEPLLLFVVSAVFACHVPDASVFGTDQTGTLMNARAVLHGELFVAGPEIGWSGFSLGPLYNQVAAIAMAMRGHFADVIVLSSLIHGLGVVAYGRLFRRFVDAPVARLAAWSLALHPLAMSIGAAPISSSLVLATTAVYFTGLARWVDDREPGGFGLACIGAALMVQAHITTLLLLPMFAIGFARRAPIERPGRVGLAIALVVAAPTILINLDELERHAGAVRHATGSGAPLLVALLRAVFLERHVLEIFQDPGIPGGSFLRASAASWGVFVGFGAFSYVTRREHARMRTFLVGAFLVPTLAVVLLPRGALYYYLLGSSPFRALFVAHSIARIVAVVRASGGARAALSAALLACIAVPSTAYMWLGTPSILQLGVVELHVGRIDLRDPASDRSQIAGILTLRSQLQLANGLARAGANANDLALHGPFRWVMSEATRFLMPGARIAHGNQSPNETTHDAFLVVHEKDHVPTPPGPRVVAGPFRIHRFRNLASSTVQEDGSVAIALRGNASTLQIVSASRPFVEAAEVRFDAVTSVAGFTTYTARWPVGASAPRSLRVRFDDPSASSPLVRLAVDVYAFDGVRAR